MTGKITRLTSCAHESIIVFSVKDDSTASGVISTG